MKNLSVLINAHASYVNVLHPRKATRSDRNPTYGTHTYRHRYDKSGDDSALNSSTIILQNTNTNFQCEYNRQNILWRQLSQPRGSSWRLEGGLLCGWRRLGWGSLVHSIVWYWWILHLKKGCLKLKNEINPYKIRAEQIADYHDNKRLYGLMCVC